MKHSNAFAALFLGLLLVVGGAVPGASAIATRRATPSPTFGVRRGAGFCDRPRPSRLDERDALTPPTRAPLLPSLLHRSQPFAPTTPMPSKYR